VSASYRQKYPEARGIASRRRQATCSGETRMVIELVRPALGADNREKRSCRLVANGGPRGVDP
jgi:hypothetical protein